ncbi:accessory Sec system protein translocase subunit SecY2 [uncultured Limosilactobacillus sp.]|uniref:accessory Sec system protein translocase subunit SecY2 n=1 Tax=uncultured Limosilactobacillus sp. TaxID=2837629 RepID=UPI0025D6D33B|nr:accessory Sec system protein translocase subunit SecY2 [uncultured Limosilactobacillus sp.]
MAKTSHLRNLYRKAGFTLFILFIYVWGSFIPLPFARITSQFSQLMHTTSHSMMAFMSGANFQQLSLFMVGLGPMMIAMILLQLLMMTRLFGFDTLSVNQMAMAQQWMTLFFAALQSAFITIGFHLTANIYQAVAVTIILTAGAMFVTWLGIMNMKFGIGGTVTLILFNIISGSIGMVRRAVTQIMKLPYAWLWLTGLLLLSLGLMVFWIAFTKAYYPLYTVDITLSSKNKPVLKPVGLNMGAMMTYMVGMALLMMPTMLGAILGPQSIFANPRFDAALSGVLTFILFYFFSFMQFSPRQQAKAFRNSNTYIPNVRPGKPTQRYLSRLMWVICFPGAVLNTIQLVFGLMGQQFLGKFGSITVIPMNIVMIVMIIGGMRDTLLTLVFPQKYYRLARKERSLEE